MLVARSCWNKRYDWFIRTNWSHWKDLYGSSFLRSFMPKPTYLLKPVKDAEGSEKETLYKLIQVMDDLTVEESQSKVQSALSENGANKTKVRVFVEGKERIPLKVLRRKSDPFGRFTLGKGDKDVISKEPLVIVLEQIDPDDRIFMEPTRHRK